MGVKEGREGRKRERGVDIELDGSRSRYDEIFDELNATDCVFRL